MKKLFTILAVAIMMFIGSASGAMAQQPVASAPIQGQPVASAPIQGHHHHSQAHVLNPATGLYHENYNGLSYDNNFYNYHITRVEKRANGTSIHIMMCTDVTGVVYVSSNIKLKDNTNGQVWSLYSTNNITADQNFNVTAGVPFEFVLNFPPVLRNCQSLSLEEPNEGDHGGMVFRNITGFSANYMN